MPLMCCCIFHQSCTNNIYNIFFKKKVLAKCEMQVTTFSQDEVPDEDVLTVKNKCTKCPCRYHHELVVTAILDENSNLLSVMWLD